MLKALAIALFFNDDDIVSDHLTHMLENNHDLVVWDHGSSDGTAREIDKFSSHIRERHFLPREFDFYQIFAHVSRHVIEHYAREYDWISFPESDEIPEGPNRAKSYYDWLREIDPHPYDWVQFNNMVYWFTHEDDASIISPRQRIKRYSIWRDCPPRVYAWRGKAMNVREFNHNPAEGKKCPVHFNTCHYQWRSEAQAMKRIEGRKGLRKGGMNVHFDNMAEIDRLRLQPIQLNKDDGGELSLRQTVDFRAMYGV